MKQIAASVLALLLGSTSARLFASDARAQINISSPPTMSLAEAEQIQHASDAHQDSLAQVSSGGDFTPADLKNLRGVRAQSSKNFGAAAQVSSEVKQDYDTVTDDLGTTYYWTDGSTSWVSADDTAGSYSDPSTDYYYTWYDNADGYGGSDSYGNTWWYSPDWTSGETSSTVVESWTQSDDGYSSWDNQGNKQFSNYDGNYGWSSYGTTGYGEWTCDADWNCSGYY
jgi:hypothetical protein